MRLLTVGSLPPELGGPVRGGAATFHAALLAGLRRREADVEVVGVLPPSPLDCEVPFPAWVRPEEVSRASFYEELLERLRPDVVLMNHFAHTIGVTHARLGSPVPAVGVVQSWHNVTFRSGEERQHAVEVTEEALAGLSAVATPSRHTMVEGGKLGFEYPPIAETIHNPVPPFYASADVDAVACKRRGAVFLGSLIERKKPGALVEAAARLPGLDVTLVGQGELDDDLRARIELLGIGNRVRLADPPSREGHLGFVREMLLRSGVMCLPSRSEGLPLVFVEALACGTPIVGFGPVVREIRDELGIEIGEPLDIGSPEEIAAALERVLDADWDHWRLREATIDAFGFERATDRYLELFSRVVHGPADPAGAGGPADRSRVPPV